MMNRLAVITALGVFAALSGCDSGGSDPASAPTPPPLPPAPAVAIAANPGSVSPGGVSLITWSSTNATACTASGAWTGAKPTSGNESVTPAGAGVTAYTLTCTGDGGSANSAATVAVNASGTTVTLTRASSTVVLGSSTTLTWSSTNATDCAAGGAWSGGKPTSGTEAVTPATLGPATYSLTCTGPGGTFIASTTVDALFSGGGSAQFLFISNDEGSVSAFKLDGSTGAPTEVAGSPFPAVGSTRWIVLRSDGRFAYAGNGGASVSAYSVNQATGELAPIPGSPFSTVSSIAGMAIHPSGNWLYVATGDDGLLTYAVDTTTGALIKVGTPASGSFSITIHPSGKFAYATGRMGANLAPGIFVYSIDNYGALTAIPGSPFAADGNGEIFIDPAGRFAYLTNPYSGSLQGGQGIFAFSIDASTGALTKVAGSPFPTATGPKSIVIDQQSAFLYLACFGSPGDTGALSVYAIDSSTGALTQVPGVPRPFNAGYYSLVVGLNRSGTVLYEYGWGSSNELHSFAIGAGGTLTEIPNTRVPRAGWSLGMALSR
jgi:6-phosphogluconolactonase